MANRRTNVGYIFSQEDERMIEGVLQRNLAHRAQAMPEIRTISDDELMRVYDPSYFDRVKNKRVIAWTTGRAAAGKCDLPGVLFLLLPKLWEIYARPPADPNDRSEPTSGVVVYATVNEALSDLREALAMPAWGKKYRTTFGIKAA